MGRAALINGPLPEHALRGLDRFQSSEGLPFLEVQYKKNLWWTVPREQSQLLFMQMLVSDTGEYQYGWPNSSISQYAVDFVTMMQTNKNDETSVRKVRWSLLRPEDVED